MVVFALVGTFLLQIPPIQQTVVKTAFGSILSFANVIIVLTTSNYFDPSAQLNPLLHTWSLSVEEQFYLFFPLILTFGYAMVRKMKIAIHYSAVPVIICSITTYILTNLAFRGYQLVGPVNTFGFYSPISRFWEFGAGAILFLSGSLRHELNRKIANVLGLCGAGLGGASLFFSKSSSQIFGWPTTVFIVISTLMVIESGINKDSLVCKFLSMNLLVSIGNRSYSIYLWHWPMLVFADVLWPANKTMLVVAALFSFLPAFISYRFLEVPFKNVDLHQYGKKFRRVLLVIAIPLVVAMSIREMDRFGFSEFYKEPQSIHANGDIGQENFHRTINEIYYPCENEYIFSVSLKWNSIVRCHQSKKSLPVDLAVIGDSHAEHLFFGLAQRLTNLNVAYYIVNASPSMEDPNFKVIVEQVSHDESVKTVLLTADWLLRGVRENDIQLVVNSFKASKKSVIITDDLPTFPFDAFVCKYQQSILITSTRCKMSAEQFWGKQDQINKRLEIFSDNGKNFELVESSQFFCSRQSCNMSKNGQVLYRDNNHLNLTGSVFLANWLIDHYENLFK